MVVLNSTREVSLQTASELMIRAPLGYQHLPVVHGKPAKKTHQYPRYEPPWLSTPGPTLRCSQSVSEILDEPEKSGLSIDPRLIELE